MKKLGLAAIAALPLAAGCYAETVPCAYYPPRSYVRVYAPRPPRVYVAPSAVYVAPPPPVRVYW